VLTFLPEEIKKKEKKKIQNSIALEGLGDPKLHIPRMIRRTKISLDLNREKK
jgi:hypothetical protein